MRREDCKEEEGEDCVFLYLEKINKVIYITCLSMVTLANWIETSQT